MGIFDRLRGDQLKIHIVIRGRIGDDWRDIDTYLRVPAGTTLGRLVEVAEAGGIPLRHALESSPHLTDTMMLNGERCPFGPGDALFVPAGADHHFEGFSEDFATWVVFWGPPGGEARLPP